MNSFETDMYRAIFSRRFLLGILAGFIIVFVAGIESELFRVSIPVLCTLPYTTALLEEMQSGFIRSYLPRTSNTAYVAGKLLTCMLSGGLTDMIPVLVFCTWKNSKLAAKLYLLQGGSVMDADYPGNLPKLTAYYGLIFLSGALWALVSATLCAWSRSKYIAYGSAFVIYYVLIILCERYFPKLYCLNPEEWFRYQHTWIFGKWGIVIMLSMLCVLLAVLYDRIVRRWIANV